MDINETKKYIQNKIDTDNLTKKVRDVIKEKKWERQDIKEGFKKSFKPLIKPQIALNQTIQETNKQNNEQIQEIRQNQLALTEGLAANRRALTEGLNTMRELLAIEQGQKDDEEDPFKNTETDIFQDDEKDLNLDPKTGAIPKKRPKIIDPEINFNEEELKMLGIKGFIRPRDFGKTTEVHLEDLLKRTNKEIQFANGAIVGLNRKKNKSEKEEEDIIKYKKIKQNFINYKHILSTFLKSLQYQLGEGVYFNNPHQLLNRLELLAGSILAGNNGVIPEFSQLAHLLNQMKVISKKQLNDLLKIYITIR